MIKVQKERDRVFITLTSQLDREDVYELVSDLQQWLEDTVQTQPVKFHNQAHTEAFEQAQRKLKLEQEMRRMFVDVLDDEYLETKFATVYKLDELNREIEITRKKLNELK
jgi:predicted metal-dependent hydrolase